MTRYWTNQTIEAWEHAQRVGYLIGNPEFIWEEFLQPYHWMINQMEKRLHYNSTDYPIWLWVDKPDLRGSGHFNKGTRAVSLEVEISSKNVLLSDFDAWHVILCNGFFALNEEEHDAFDRGEIPMTKEESWERLFDFEILSKNTYWNNSPLCLQGVTGKIDITQVKKVRKFVARGMNY
jgi:hypothetical protein